MSFSNRHSFQMRFIRFLDVRTRSRHWRLDRIGCVAPDREERKQEFLDCSTIYYQILPRVKDGSDDVEKLQVAFGVTDDCEGRGVCV